MRLRALPSIVVLAASCTVGNDPVDGGVVDGGRVDAGVVDGDVVDGGRVDTGVVDGGGVDGGRVDSGGVYADVVDGGRVDSGGVDDGGHFDGAFVDSGWIDAGLSAGPCHTFDWRWYQFNQTPGLRACDDVSECYVFGAEHTNCGTSEPIVGVVNVAFAANVAAFQANAEECHIGGLSDWAGLENLACLDGQCSVDFRCGCIGCGPDDAGTPAAAIDAGIDDAGQSDAGLDGGDATVAGLDGGNATDAGGS